MLKFFTILVFLYVLILVYMALYQRKLMYLPDRNIEPPEFYGLQGFDDLRFRNTEGHSLQFWYKPALQGFPTIVYFHGNASHIGGRADILGALAKQGFGVAAVSYRGYGLSESTPSEKGIYEDARTALHYLDREYHIAPERIILFGESLGTGVAVQMATEFPIAGLVLQAAYTSVAGRAAEIYYFLPVRWLIHDRFDSIKKIHKVKAPLLLFHGERDNVIPVVHGKTLFEAATSPKQAFFFPHVLHNDFDSEMISSHVLAFAKEHNLILQ